MIPPGAVVLISAAQVNSAFANVITDFYDHLPNASLKVILGQISALDFDGNDRFVLANRYGVQQDWLGIDETESHTNGLGNWGKNALMTRQMVNGQPVRRYTSAEDASVAGLIERDSNYLRGTPGDAWVVQTNHENNTLDNTDVNANMSDWSALSWMSVASYLMTGENIYSKPESIPLDLLLNESGSMRASRLETIEDTNSVSLLNDEKKKEKALHQLGTFKKGTYKVTMHIYPEQTGNEIDRRVPALEINSVNDANLTLPVDMNDLLQYTSLTVTEPLGNDIDSITIGDTTKSMTDVKLFDKFVTDIGVVTNVRYNTNSTKHLATRPIRILENDVICLLYTSPSPRDRQKSRMPSSA